MKYQENYIQGSVSKCRQIIPKGVVLHHTGEYSEKSIISTFTNSTTSASAHVVIWKDGRRTVFAKDTQRAWHAGASKFKGLNDCNSFMLGVEFQGDTNQFPLTKEQIESFIEWFDPRKLTWKIKLDWVTDHKTIAPGRKVDINQHEFEKVISTLKSKCYV